jgi:hypothetical protein
LPEAKGSKGGSLRGAQDCVLVLVLVLVLARTVASKAGKGIVELSLSSARSEGAAIIGGLVVAILLDGRDTSTLLVSFELGRQWDVEEAYVTRACCKARLWIIEL